MTSTNTPSGLWILIYLADTAGGRRARQNGDSSWISLCPLCPGDYPRWKIIPGRHGHSPNLVLEARTRERQTVPVLPNFVPFPLQSPPFVPLWIKKMYGIGVSFCDYTKKMSQWKGFGETLSVVENARCALRIAQGRTVFIRYIQMLLNEEVCVSDTSTAREIILFSREHRRRRELPL